MAYFSKRRVKCMIEDEICLSVLIGGAFERLFCPKGREFEQANLQKFKCPGGCPRGGGVELSN